MTVVNFVANIVSMLLFSFVFMLVSGAILGYHDLYTPGFLVVFGSTYLLNITVSIVVLQVQKTLNAITVSNKRRKT